MNVKTRSDRTFIFVIAILWLAIPVADGLGKLLLEREFFAFRAWEIVKVWGKPHPFKADVHFAGRIYGDLANMLKIRRYRRYRHQEFQTDAYGFRNPDFPAQTHFPVVVVGDSDMAGSSLSDRETFSAQLAAVLEVPVYNYAPKTVPALLSDPRFAQNPPRVIVWEAVERTITGPAYQAYANLPAGARLRVRAGNAAMHPDIPEPLLTEFFARQVFHEVRYCLTGLHANSIGHIEKATGMLFYALGLAILQQDNGQRGLETVLEGIGRVDRLCRARGVTLIYMPLPDKENIYSHRLPDHLRADPERKPFLEALRTGMNQRKILNVDLHRQFRDRAHEEEPFYFQDDTHWNPKGVQAAAAAAARLIKAHHLLP